MNAEYELGLIGSGFMAEAIVSGALRAGLLQPDDVLAADPSAARREVFSTSLGVAVTDDNRRVALECDVVLLAVKPQQFDEVAAELAPLLKADQTLISILAGVPTQRIEAAFGAGTTRVVRAMPNLPMTVGAGMTGVFAGRHAAEADVTFALRLFEAGGRAVRIDDEQLMDAVTAVSGSGPAYFCYFVEAIVAGGLRAGLPRATAELLAKQTCLGAARQMLESHEAPGVLRERVTSKGGTTAAALEHMQQQRVDELIAQAVVKAFERGQALGRGEG